MGVTMNDDAQVSIPANSELLGELLHSLSQPLTALRCSLELSLDAGPQQQQDAVTSALEQTENVIGTIQLMREYLDTEMQRTTLPEIAFMPVLQGVVEALSSLAALRRVQLRLIGTCLGRLRTSRWHLRKALEYLLSAMIEEQQPDSELTLRLGDEPAGAIVRIQGQSRPKMQSSHRWNKQRIDPELAVGRSGRRSALGWRLRPACSKMPALLL